MLPLFRHLFCRICSRSSLNDLARGAALATPGAVLALVAGIGVALAALLSLALPLPAHADDTVLYDSGGFEGFALGSLVSAPQDGWMGTAIDGALDPEIVLVGGNKKLRLAVPDGDPPFDHRKESRVVKSFASPLFLSGMTHIVVECDLTLDADGSGQRQNVYFDFDPHPNKFLSDAQIVQDNNYVQMVRGGDQTNGIGAGGNASFHMVWDFDLQTGTVTTVFGTRTIDAASAVSLQSIIGNQPGEDPDGNANTLDAMSYALVSDFWQGPGDAVLFDNFIVRGDPRPTPPPETIRPRTVLLSYDPILEAQGGVRLHAYAGWNDPYPLTQEYIADLTSSSHGWYEPRLTQNVVIDAFPLKEDGFRYTDQSYSTACTAVDGICPTGSTTKRSCGSSIWPVGWTAASSTRWSCTAPPTSATTSPGWPGVEATGATPGRSSESPARRSSS